MIDKRALDSLGECFYSNEYRDTMCAQDAERSGLEVLGSGSNRYVFEDPDEGVAYKFAKGVDGRAGNRREVNLFYEEASPELRAHLAAPHEWDEDYKWVQFHRYPEEGFREHERANELIDGAGWECWDLHAGNVIGPPGEDEFVIADYESCSVP